MADPSIALEDVHVRVKDCCILDDVSLSSGTCEWTLLVGPSGCGKSTILRTINGLCPPSKGRVLNLGTWLPGRNRHEARKAWRSTGTVLQEVALFETRTVLTNVELGCRAAGLPADKARSEALSWLDRLGLVDRAADHPASLSGGQRQRVALARAFAPRPRLLLLDEPTSALDHATAQVVLDGISELVENGTCVVMSSHRPEEVGVRCTRCVVLDGGRVVQVTSGVPDLAAPWNQAPFDQM